MLISITVICNLANIYVYGPGMFSKPLNLYLRIYKDLQLAHKLFLQFHAFRGFWPIRREIREYLLCSATFPLSSTHTIYSYSYMYTTHYTFLLPTKPAPAAVRWLLTKKK